MGSPEEGTDQTDRQLAGYLCEREKPRFCDESALLPSAIPTTRGSTESKDSCSREERCALYSMYVSFRTALGPITQPHNVWGHSDSQRPPP